MSLPRVKTRPVLLATLILIATFPSWTGVKASDEAWRPIDASHLAMKSPIVEPDAEAEVIFWEVTVDDSGDSDLVFSHYARIKIFTERGREIHSKVDIPYFSGTKIKDVAARTIKSDGAIVELPKTDIVEKTVVKVSGIKLKSKSFALAGIEPGAIIEYRWKEVISNASAINMRLQFQREIPIQVLTYRIKHRGNFVPKLRAFNMRGPEFEKDSDGFYRTTVTKIPAFHEEPLMPPEDNVRGWAMVSSPYAMEGLTGYNFLAGQIHRAVQPFMKVDKEVTRKAEEITAGATTPDEKLQGIFDFCRRNIKNTTNPDSGLSDEQLEKENKKPADTIKRGFGTGPDINLLFAALANAAGLHARVILMPDRGNWLFKRNDVIPGLLKPSTIGVLVDGKWRFFDPGLEYLSPGMLRWQEEGVDALIVDEAPRWVFTPMSPPDKSKEIRVATLRLDENGTLEGDVTIEYSGHLAVEKKLINADYSPDKREETLKEAVKKRLSSAELTNIAVENATDHTRPFVYKYHVRVPDYAKRTGKRLFLQPAFFQKGLGALFPSSTRKFPVYFHFSWSEVDKVTITLPKGYVLDSADRPAPITAGTVCKYDVQMGVNKDETMLVYNRSFLFGGGDAILFKADQYEQIKRLFDEINKADNHMITLKQNQ